MILISNICFSQIGGRRSFEFLNVPVNATTTALGGTNISLVSEDPSMLLQNPALTDSLESHQISFGYLGYYAGVNQSTFSYVQEVKGRLINFGVNYLNYGDIDGFDATGAPTGDFQAREYVVNAGTSQKIGVFTVGANVKFAHSLIDNFTASALLVDIGGVFRPTATDWTISLLAKNLGFTLSNYTNQQSIELPFDIQLGTSFKPEFMPVRFSFTASNITRNNVGFVNRSLNPNDSEPGIGEEVFRRINIGTEFLLGKGVRILVGYNHRIRKELRLQQLAAGAGFSFGMFLRIKMIDITYARSTYQAAGGINHVTIVTNLKKFKKAKL
ncbi:MAG: type IX secretion system protein PorQ [Cyclobacteriaceae bacterium]